MKKLQAGNIWLSGLLLVGLLALLFVYLQTVSNLDTQIYNPEQREFLENNEARGLTQQPLTANFYRYDRASVADGIVNGFLDTSIIPVSPGSFAVWENSVQATLTAHYEEQEGVSVTLYDLDFESTYHFEHAPTAVTTTLELIFPFPANLETLNDVEFEVDGEAPLDVQYTPQQIRWATAVFPGDKHDISIRYRASGAGNFAYGLSRDRRTNTLDVALTITGLQGSEVPSYSLGTTAVSPTATGQTFRWQYNNLVANRDIHLTLPAQLSFVQRVAAFQDDFQLMGNIAPFLAGLFLLSLAGLFYIDDIALGLPGYLLVGLGFVLFYPLLTFLSGQLGITLAAILSLFIVSALMFAFLSLVIGGQRVALRLLWLLLVFLGVLSLGVLTPFRGLMFTAGGLMLVGTFMVVYAKRPLSSSHEPSTTINAPNTTESNASFRAYCPQCGRGQTADYLFCPGCGYKGENIQQCAACGHEQVVEDVEQEVFCIHCGKPLS